MKVRDDLEDRAGESTEKGAKQVGILLRDITKTYGSGDEEVRALRGVSLDVAGVSG